MAALTTAAIVLGALASGVFGTQAVAENFDVDPFGKKRRGLRSVNEDALNALLRGQDLRTEEIGADLLGDIAEGIGDVSTPAGEALGKVPAVEARAEAELLQSLTSTHSDKLAQIAQSTVQPLPFEVMMARAGVV